VGWSIFRLKDPIFLKGNQEKGNIPQEESKLQVFDSF
jgi:hypothetical protein